MEEGDVNFKENKSTKTQMCIVMMISCECTSENGNRAKSKKCDQ
jgi:hypothetical protein